jgi:hypothetical protein
MRKSLSTTLILVACGSAGAQETPIAPETLALRQCTVLADSGKGDAAREPGVAAQGLYQNRVNRNPKDVEALVGLARAKAQCLVPSAGFMDQGQLSSDAMDLLDQALRIQPDNWMARYLLASIAYRSPAFLGRGTRAAQELDELLRWQGDRTDNPTFARVFAMRGMLLSRAGQTDSAQVLWAKGAALFPEDAELQRLLRSPRGSPDRSASAAVMTGVTAVTVRADSAAATVESTRPDTATLEAVRVSARAVPERPPLPSTRDVTRSQVLMTAGGAADVMQAVQLLPGATRMGEGGDVYTRGGDASETSLILNGSRILSLARFEGLNGSLFGAIEPFVVKSVRYSSGGFSAKHGNSLSGVLEVETDGRPSERSARAGLSLVQASGTIRESFNRRMGGWVSGRASHTGALLETHGRTEEFSGAPQSQELIGSIVATLTPLTEVRATALIERDESRRIVNAAGWRGDFLADGDTRAFMLSSRWISPVAPLVVRANMATSSRGNAWAFGVLHRDRDESSRTARVDAEWQPVDGLVLRSGVEQGSHLRLDDGTVPTTSSVAPGAPALALDHTRSGTNQVGGYVEAEKQSGRFSLTLGVRADRLPGETHVSMDPRLAVAARAGQWTARVSGGVFHQGRWRGEAAIPDAGTPSGLAHTAHHVVVGVERESSTHLIRAEAFSKRYFDFRPFGSGPAIARAHARGIDLIAQRMVGATTGFVGYSLLDATSTLADSRQVRGVFDITHSATASITSALDANWSVGSTVRYGAGAPHTPILGGAPTADGRTEPVYGALMSERMPAYLRLDARLMRYARLPSALVTMFAEVLNVTNRGNVQTWTYDPTYNSRQPVRAFFATRTIVVGAELMVR